MSDKASTFMTRIRERAICKIAYTNYLTQESSGMNEVLTVLRSSGIMWRGVIMDKVVLAILIYLIQTSKLHT
jgi:hypothetical protein